MNTRYIISIKRVDNGWILTVDDSEGTITAVHEDSANHDSGYANQAESLADLLYSAMPHLFRTKYQGGMRITVHEEGSEQNEVDDFAGNK